MRYFSLGKDEQTNNNGDTQVVYHRKPIFGDSRMSQSKLWKRDSASVSLHRGDFACPQDLREAQHFKIGTRNLSSVKVQPRKNWAKESSQSDDEQLNKIESSRNNFILEPPNKVQNQRKYRLKLDKISIQEPPIPQQSTPLQIKRSSTQNQSIINQLQKLQRDSYSFQKAQKPLISSKVEREQSNHMSLAQIRQQRELLQKSAQLDIKVQNMTNQNRILLSQHFICSQVLISNKKRLNSLQNMQKLEIMNVDYKRKLFDAKEKAQKMFQKNQSEINPEIVKQIMEILSF